MFRRKAYSGFIRRGMASSTMEEMEALCSVLPSSELKYYLCGPPSVRRTQIHWCVSGSGDQDEASPRNFGVGNSWGAGRRCWEGEVQINGKPVFWHLKAQGRGIGHALCGPRVQNCNCRGSQKREIQLCQEKSVQDEKVSLRRNESFHVSLRISKQSLHQASGTWRTGKEEQESEANIEKERQE